VNKKIVGDIYNGEKYIMNVLAIKTPTDSSQPEISLNQFRKLFAKSVLKDSLFTILQTIEDYCKKKEIHD
jgi:hypothetical protein